MQADRAPLVGIWVSGITNLWHPFTVAAAMAFHACASTRRCKTLAPDGSFLLLIYPSGTGSRQPELFEACVDAPRGLPLLPRTISMEIPAGSTLDHRGGDAAASKIPCPQAASGTNELRAAALMDRAALTYCLQAGRTPAADATPKAAKAPVSTSCDVSPSAAGPAACMSLSTWQSDPPVSAAPVPRAREAAPPVMALRQASATEGSGRSSSLSHAASRATSRSALATWSREFPVHGQGTAGGVRADTPVGAAATTAGSALSRQQQFLVTPRLHGVPPVPSSRPPGGMPGPGLGGMPPVPAPSPLVADSVTACIQGPRAAHSVAAPHSGAPHRASQWGPSPASAVTGTGPLSLGSMPPVTSVPSQFTTAIGAYGASGPRIPSGRIADPGLSAAGNRSNEGAPAAGSAAADAGVGMPSSTGGLPTGMPEWLTSAVGRHPELAVLLERNTPAAEACSSAADVPVQGARVKGIEPEEVLDTRSGGPESAEAAATARANAKRQRDGAEQGAGAEAAAGGNGGRDGETAGVDDEDTVALTALLDGDVASDPAEPEGSLHAVLAPGGLSEAELAALATRSPSHAGTVSPSRQPAETGQAVAAVPRGEGRIAPEHAAAGARLPGPEQSLQIGDEAAPECLSTPDKPPRGPSEAHRAVKSPRIGPADRPGVCFGRVDHGGAADTAQGGMAVGVPAVPFGIAAAQPVVHGGAPAAASHLMPLPLPPVLQCTDAEATAALAPLYAYISRLQRHIEVLQGQLQTGQAPGAEAFLHAHRLQASMLAAHGQSEGPFPGVPYAGEQGAVAAADSTPDSPAALPPASGVPAAVASTAGRHLSPQSGLSKAQHRVSADHTAAAPVEHTFKIIRASGRLSSASPSVDPIARQAGSTDRHISQAAQQQQHGERPRERRPDAMRDSLEEAAASFLQSGDEIRGRIPDQEDAPPAADGAPGRSGSGAGTPQHAQRQDAQPHGSSAYADSDGSRIQASWPATRDSMVGAEPARHSCRPPSRQVTGAMFGGSPDKVFSTDELKAALAAAEAAAEAAVAPPGSSPQLGRAGLSDDAADAIVDSFLVASHSPQHSPDKATGRHRAGRGDMQRASLSSKRERGMVAADADIHAARPPHGHARDAAGEKGSPAALRRLGREGSHALSAPRRSHLELEPGPPPVAAAASAVDASSVCPETEAPSTPAALPHGRAHSGSVASGVAGRCGAPANVARSPARVLVR